MARQRSTGGSRKGKVGDMMMWDMPGSMGSSGIDMFLAPDNPQAGQRYIDDDKTVNHCVNYLMGLKDHEELMIIRDGYVQAHCKGQSGSCGFSDNANAKVAGSHLLHNHPRDVKGVNGGTFSLADVRCLAKGMKTFEAVGAEGRYVISVNKNSNIRGFIRECEIAQPNVQLEMQKSYKDGNRAWREGLYKSKEEARADIDNRQLNVIHEYYARTAEKYGITYYYEANDEGLQRMAVRDRIEAEQVFKSGLKKGKAPDKNKKKSKKKRGRKKADNKNQIVRTEIYNDGRHVTYGVTNGTGEFIGFDHKTVRKGKFKGDKVHYAEKW